MFDKLTGVILETINRSRHPLTSTEVFERVNKKTKEEITRVMVTKRLNKLRDVKEINGKKIGTVVPTWVWYKREKRKR